MYIDDIETPTASDTYAELLKRYSQSNTVYYRDYRAPTKENTVIGGNVCHLCGATLKSIDQTSVLKKDGSNKMDYRCTEYRCGTAVIQNFGKITRVEVGSNCIIF